MESVLKTSLPVRTAVIAFHKPDLTKNFWQRVKNRLKAFKTKDCVYPLHQQLAVNKIRRHIANCPLIKNSQKINNSALPSVKGIRSIEFF